MADTLISMPIETVTEAEEQPSLTYRLDLENGRIVGKVDGVEAVNQAMRKAVITPRFKCLIYDHQYGSEVEDAIIAGDATKDYIEAATEGFVKDALLPDTRILSVRDFNLFFEDGRVRINFKADTIFGETEFEEVI